MSGITGAHSRWHVGRGLVNEDCPLCMDPSISLLYPVMNQAPIMQRFGDNAPIYRPFGYKGHNGLDIGVVEGTAVLAMHDGVVRFAGDGFNEVLMGASAGNCVLLTTDSYLTGYAHLSRVYVHNEDSVKAGDVIGLSGKSGAVSGQHLHVELIPTPLQLDNGYLGRVDPLPYLDTPLASAKGTPLPVPGIPPSDSDSQDTQVSHV